MSSAPVIIYSSPLCGYCWAAKRILQKLNVDFREINCNENPQECAEVRARTGHRTVPMIFVGSHFIGGCDELRRLVQRDAFLPLLEAHGTRESP
mgnify:FL=1